MREVGQVELIREKCLKKKERNLSAMKMKKKKGMFCEIYLHGKILLKCQSGVDEGM